MMFKIMPETPRLLFVLAWWFIIFASVVDAYLLSYCRDVIGDYERNPAGNMLLAIGGGRVWLFLLLKFVGTILACMWLMVIYRRNPRLGFTIAMVIASFQLGLLIYLGYA